MVIAARFDRSIDVHISGIRQKLGQLPDGSAITEYFQPLNVWLTKQNKGERCGW